MLDYFSKADKGLDVALRWFGAFTLLSGLASGLAKSMSWLGNLNWADAIFVGIAIACLITIVLSLALIAVRLFRPLSKSSHFPAPELDYGPVTEWQDIRITVENLEIELKSAQENLREQVKETTVVSNRLDTVTKLTNKMSGQTSEYVELLRSQDETLRNEMRDLHHRAEVANRELSKLSQRVGESFAALQQREFLSVFDRHIGVHSSTLYDRLRAGERYDERDWAEWEKVHCQWRSMLNRWLDNARFYFRDISDVVLRTDDEKYRGEWTVSDEQFPNAEAVRTFKQYRIQQSQWEEAKEAVESRIKQVAFVGLRECEVQASD